MPLSRRHFLATSTAAAASASGLLTPHNTSATEPPPAPSPQPLAPAAFSFIHLTDQHVTNRRHAPEGYARCIAAINALDPAPDFVLMGGDMVFDGCYTALADYQNQLRLFQDITRNLKTPWHPCLGNHDILGWHEREKVAPTDPGYGKRLIMDALQWRDPYYSFDHKGWHFAVLDSCHAKKSASGAILQEPRIGPEQLEWLAYDLGTAGDRPKIAVVHVAALCNVGQISGDPKHLAMDGAMVLWDTVELRQVLERHNVKLLLQGHSHRVEDTFWNGTWYVTGAAASGAWWGGSWTGSDPGYTIVRCDGDKVTWSHESYPWEPQLDERDELERQKIAAYNRQRENQQRLRQLERAGRKQ